MKELFSKNIYSYLISNNLIIKSQSGFRPSDSVVTSVHDIHTAFGDQNCLEVRSVYLDITKAFDKVWHEGLIFKLQENDLVEDIIDQYPSSSNFYEGITDKTTWSFETEAKVLPTITFNDTSTVPKICL